MAKTRPISLLARSNLGSAAPILESQSWTQLPAPWMRGFYSSVRRPRLSLHLLSVAFRGYQEGGTRNVFLQMALVTPHIDQT